MTKHSCASDCREFVSEEAFCSWIGAAAPGQALVYHRGHLALDAQASANRLELARLAKRARMAAEAGLVHLVQRRHGPDDYTYLAVARPRGSMGPRGALDDVLSRAAG